MFRWPRIGGAVVQLRVEDDHLLQLVAAINGVMGEIVGVEMGDSVDAWGIEAGDCGRVEEEAVVSV
jgi:hypothetical protein